MCALMVAARRQPRRPVQGVPGWTGSRVQVVGPRFCGRYLEQHEEDADGLRYLRAERLVVFRSRPGERGRPVLAADGRTETCSSASAPQAAPAARSGRGTASGSGELTPGSGAAARVSGAERRDYRVVGQDMDRRSWVRNSAAMPQPGHRAS